MRKIHPINAFNKLKIRTKLIFVYSFLFVAIISIIHTAIYALLKNTIETNIESELNNSTILIRNMAEAAADVSIKNHLSGICEMNREIVQHFYDLYLRGNLTEEQAEKQAKDVLLQQTIGKTGYIYCVDSRGILQVHPEPSLVGQDISNYEFIQMQIHRKEGYLEYDWKNPGDVSERPKALHMAYFEPWDWIISVSSYREEFKDLVNINDFSSRITSLKFGETGYSYVIDSHGTAIIHPKLAGVSIWDSQDSDGRFFIQEMCRKKSGSIVYPWKNPGEEKPRDKQVIYSYLPDLDWIVASSSYMEEFYRPLTFLRYTVAGSFLIALLLILPLTMWLGSYIIQPLQRVIGKLQSAKEDDFSVRMPVESEDEIGQLSVCFNGYMENLERYSSQLQDLNENLEIRVEERTAELSKALAEVKTLHGLLPICANCKKIRNDKGYWEQLETYIESYSDAQFSHGICEECADQLYGELEWYKKSKQRNASSNPQEQ